MVSKFLFDGNDVNNDNSDDDVKISFYKILKEIMYIDVTKVQGCFERALRYKLMQEVTFSGTCKSKTFK